jgi:hypothetical protein
MPNGDGLDYMINNGLISPSAANKMGLGEALTSGLAADPTLGQTAPGLGEFAGRVARGVGQWLGYPGEVYRAGTRGEAPSVGEMVPWAANTAMTMVGTPGGGGGLGSGIRAYHGSPYDFERFSTQNIGTGEGAQAYGHGLYFAESEPTALSYKNAMRVTDMDWPVQSSIESILKGNEGTKYADVPAWVARGSLSSPTRAEEILKDFRQRAVDMKAEGHWNAQGIQNITDTLEGLCT